MIRKKRETVFPCDKREAFARRSCSNNNLTRDDDSCQSHRALVEATFGRALPARNRNHLGLRRHHCYAQLFKPVEQPVDETARVQQQQTRAPHARHCLIRHRFPSASMMRYSLTASSKREAESKQMVNDANGLRALVVTAAKLPVGWRSRLFALRPLTASPARPA